MWNVIEWNHWSESRILSSISLGWIHGVYTPQHSLVFGGNFLHSLHITRQLGVNFVEKALKVMTNIF